MKLVDNKNRNLKIGDKVRVVTDVPSVDGMLYKDRIVTIEQVNNQKIRVKCSLGKIWWVAPNHISASFL